MVRIWRILRDDGGGGENMGLMEMVVRIVVMMVMMIMTTKVMILPPARMNMPRLTVVYGQPGHISPSGMRYMKPTCTCDSTYSLP